LLFVILNSNYDQLYEIFAYTKIFTHSLRDLDVDKVL